MRDQPDGAELLRAARALLLETLLPVLPENRRYEGLMIASAMAIAAREMAAPNLEADLPEGQATALAMALRQGRKDGNTEAYEILCKDAMKRLQVSNPKLLAAGGASKSS